MQILKIILIALTFVTVSFSASAQQCTDYFANTETGTRVLSNVNVDGKPKFVDLQKVFPDLGHTVFIGVEAWGHTFLQVGDVRLDGHILRPAEVTIGAKTMRHGLVAEISNVSETQFNALQNVIQQKNGKMTVSCVNEASALLRSTLGLNFTGNERDYMWLTDLAESLINVPKSDVTVQFTKELDAALVLERLRKQELTWRNDLLVKLKEEPSVAQVLGGDKSKLPEASDFVQRTFNLSDEQTQYLITEFFAKVDSGQHTLSTDRPPR
jgi:hypothetical protein